LCEHLHGKAASITDDDRSDDCRRAPDKEVEIELEERIAKADAVARPYERFDPLTAKRHRVDAEM